MFFVWLVDIAVFSLEMGVLFHPCVWMVAPAFLHCAFGLLVSSFEEVVVSIVVSDFSWHVGSLFLVVWACCY